MIPMLTFCLSFKFRHRQIVLLNEMRFSAFPCFLQKSKVARFSFVAKARGTICARDAQRLSVLIKTANRYAADFKVFRLSSM